MTNWSCSSVRTQNMRPTSPSLLHASCSTDTTDHMSSFPLSVSACRCLNLSWRDTVSHRRNCKVQLKGMNLGYWQCVNVAGMCKTAKHKLLTKAAYSISTSRFTALWRLTWNFVCISCSIIFREKPASHSWIICHYVYRILELRKVYTWNRALRRDSTIIIKTDCESIS